MSWAFATTIRRAITRWRIGRIRLRRERLLEIRENYRSEMEAYFSGEVMKLHLLEQRLRHSLSESAPPDFPKVFRPRSLR